MEALENYDKKVGIIPTMKQGVKGKALENAEFADRPGPARRETAASPRTCWSGRGELGLQM